MKKSNNKSTIFSLYGNIILLVIKGIIGVMFNNQSFLADTINSAGDIFGSLMAYIGNKISNVPADEDHNYGHGKADYLYSLYIGIGMIFASILVIIKSISSIFNGTTSNFSILLIIGAALTLFIKIILCIITKSEYKKTNNYLLLSLYKDHRNDTIISLCTMISSIFLFFNIYVVDIVIGIAISSWIIISGFEITKNCKKILMDECINKEEEKLIIELVNNKFKAVKLEKLTSIPIGNKYILVISIMVDGNMTVKDSHKLTKRIQSAIKKSNFNVDRVIIHVNPED